MNFPFFFQDEMVKGAFKSFVHDHHFEKMNENVLMIDKFSYQSPFGIIGRIADGLFLKKYMTELLIKRNEIIKEVAETNKWKEVI